MTISKMYGTAVILFYSYLSYHMPVFVTFFTGSDMYCIRKKS